MSLRKLVTFVAGLALTGLVSADCQISNDYDPAKTDVETKKELCEPMDDGTWSLSYLQTDIDVPTFDPDNIWAGYVSSKSWLLYDSKCTLKGVYNKPDDCGIPWLIQENFLKNTIIINSVNLDLGDVRYTFAYGAGEYMIGENGAKCHDVSYGVTGSEACSVAFPV